MTELEFVEYFQNAIYHIAETIEENDKKGFIEIDLNDSILTLATPFGTYVINKQNSIQQIWLSSPISGPYHFFLQNNEWVTKHGVNFYKLLTEELNIKITDVAQ